MNMTVSAQAFQRDKTIDRFESVLARRTMTGMRTDDPMVAAFLMCLKQIDWTASATDLFQSMPHIPQTFTLEDFRNSFFRLGVITRVEGPTPKALAAIQGPALLIDKSGVPFVISTEDTTRAIDPIAFTPRTKLVKRGDRLLTFQATNGEVPRTGTSWFRGRIFAMRGWILQLVLIKVLITILSTASAFGIMAMYSLVLPAQATDTLVALGIGLGIAALADASFRHLRARVSAKILARTDYVASTEILEKILSLPMERLGQAGGDAQANRSRQLAAAPRSLAGPVLEVLIDLPIAAFLLIGFAFWSWQLALIPLGLCFLCSVLAFFAYSSLVGRSREALKARSKYSSLVYYLCHNLHQIHAKGDEIAWFKRMARASRETALAEQRTTILQQKLDAVTAALVPLASGMIAVVGALLAMNGQISNGTLLAAMIISWRILAPIRGTYHILSRLADFRSQIKQIDALMELPKESTPVSGTPSLVFGSGIELRKVGYRYPGSMANALNGVSAAIPERSFIALTGPSGSGKTTLLRCIGGLYKPTTGQVLIGGLHSAQIPTGSLRTAISYVPGNPSLIHGTIAQNLQVAKPWATEDEMLSLCDVFGLSAFITSLPQGLNTRLTLSRRETIAPGTRQALAMVRAVITKPRVLLLDETAGAMDAEFESALLTWIQELRGETTVILSTHRPSHARLADYELTMNSGVATAFSAQKGTGHA